MLTTCFVQLQTETHGVHDSAQKLHRKHPKIIVRLKRPLTKKSKVKVLRKSCLLLNKPAAHLSSLSPLLSLVLAPA